MEELKPSTILVVEDEKVTRLVITNLLKREGFNVVGAEDGVDALRALQGEKVDLILSDIHMPVMDGFAFFEKVQQNPDLQGVPFIFLTSLTGQEHLMLGKELGVDDYLMKPVDRDVLLASIRGKLKRAARVEATRASEVEDLKRQIMKLLSDEVKAPLDVITNLSSLLLDRDITITPEHLDNLLQAIKAGGDRLQRGLDDFIMSLNIDSGTIARQYESEKTSEDLGPLVSQVVSRSSSYAGPKKVQVVWNPPSSLPRVVAARKHLEYMLERLLYSAVALSNPDAGVEISAEVGYQQVTLEIRDGGTGIDEDDVAHIFDKFHAIRRPDSDEYPIGLGLYVAKRLAEINRFDLTCFSQPDKGTSFTLTILSS